jgi:hypothetical protein
MLLKKNVSTSIALAFSLSISAVGAAHASNGFTFGIKKTQVYNGEQYVLFGRIGADSPLSGNTPKSARRGLLCVSEKRINGPTPPFIQPSISPGKATVNSWSGRQFLVIPNVQGNTLLNKADADQKCNTVAQIVYGSGSAFRIAEFHDGTPMNPSVIAGWGFWAKGFGALEGLSTAGLSPASPSTARYWIDVNNGAHPW